MLLLRLAPWPPANPSHLGSLVPSRQPEGVHDGGRRIGLHSGVQPAAAQQAHPGSGGGGVGRHAGQPAVHHVPGGVELQHVSLAEQGDAVQRDGLHGGCLVVQALLQGRGQGRWCGLAPASQAC